jgi:secreted trypsin-like serine protease
MLLLLISTTCFCLNLASKITTGTQVNSARKFPFLVNIQKEFFFDNSSFLDLHCGGVFIPPNSVLTAAHCSYSTVADRDSEILAGSELDSVLIFGNQLNRSDYTAAGIVKFKVLQIIIHPLYNASRISYDAAIWKVSLLSGDSSILKTDITLDADTSAWIGKNATIAGFGALFGEPVLQTQIMREAQVPIISSSQCQAHYNVEMIDESWVCAGNFENHTDIQAGTCFGDSGGPLFKEEGRNAITLIGIISNGANIQCGHQPDAYTRIAAIKDWILLNTKTAGFVSKFERNLGETSSSKSDFNLCVSMAIGLFYVFLWQ